MLDDPIVPDPVTDYEMAQAMIFFGGSFVRMLGQLWHRADEENRAIILAAWPGYVEEYRELARLKRDQQAYRRELAERARQG